MMAFSSQDGSQGGLQLVAVPCEVGPQYPTSTMCRAGIMAPTICCCCSLRLGPEMMTSSGQTCQVRGQDTPAHQQLGGRRLVAL